MILNFKFVSLFLLIQFLYSICASEEISFSNLKGYDLNKNEVSFEKYANKCVLLVQLSPHSYKPKIQVLRLNKIYDKYNERGLEIVAISTHSFDRLTKKFKKMHPKFDIYTKQLKSDLNRFLRKSEAHLNKFDKILIDKNGQFFSSHFFTPYMGHWTTKNVYRKLNKSIEMCLEANYKTTVSVSTDQSTIKTYDASQSTDISTKLDEY